VHSEEFEISLARELNVFKNTIQRTWTSPGLLEQKHNKTTAVFIEELQNGNLKRHFAG